MSYQSNRSPTSMPDVTKDPDVPTPKRSPLPNIMLVLLIGFTVGTGIILLLLRLALSDEGPKGRLPAETTNAARATAQDTVIPKAARSQ